MECVLNDSTTVKRAFRFMLTGRDERFARLFCNCCRKRTDCIAGPKFQELVVLLFSCLKCFRARAALKTSWLNLNVATEVFIALIYC
jgi:hypothetical protein